MTHSFETYQPHGSGDFLSENAAQVPDTVKELGGRSDTQILYDRNGILIENRWVQTEDGKKYNVTSSTIFNSEPERINNVSALETTAFLTQPKGMYVHGLLTLGKLGMEGTVVSSPHGVGITSLDHGAHNVLAIGHHDTLRNNRNLTYQVHEGKSRGAMYAMPMNRYAHKFGKHLIFNHLTAPCIPERPKILRVLKGIGPGVTEEILTLESAFDIDASARFHYGSTLDTSWDAGLVHAQEGLALLTGDAGWHAQYMSETTFGFTHNTARDGLCNAAMWQMIFSKFEGMTVQTEPRGGHMNIIGRKFHEQFRANMTTVHDVLADNPSVLSGSPDDVIRSFSNLAAEQNPKLRPLPLSVEAA